MGTHNSSVTLMNMTNEFDFLSHFLALKPANAAAPVGATLFQHWHEDNL